MRSSLLPCLDCSDWLVAACAGVTGSFVSGAVLLVCRFQVELLSFHEEWASWRLTVNKKRFKHERRQSHWHTMKKPLCLFLRRCYWSEQLTWWRRSTGCLTTTRWVCNCSLTFDLHWSVKQNLDLTSSRVHRGAHVRLLFLRTKRKMNLL